MELVRNGKDFTVIRQRTSATESGKRYTIDVMNRTCQCGEWQEHGYPCVDAMAYYRLFKKHPMNYIIGELVEKFHTYETMRDNMMVVFGYC